MGNLMGPHVYRNDDSQDDDMISFFHNADEATVRTTVELQVLMSGRPNLMFRSMRVLRSHNPEADVLVRVFSWNVLAQALAKSVDGFPRQDRTLNWTERRFYIMQEILKYNPDVICLQEVDHFRLIDACLGSTRYIGDFKKKPFSPCLYVEANNGPDGVALFYNCDKFDWVCWSERVLEICGIRTNQVILGGILRSRADNIELFIAVSHLKAKNGCLMGQVRDWEGKDVLRWLEREAGGRPVILCGDFNAPPTEAVYRRIMKHRLNLKSAYNIDGQEPEYTTWTRRDTGEEKKTVDYIFHSDTLVPLKILSLPHPGDVFDEKFPNESYPSDHLSLVVDLGLKSRFPDEGKGEEEEEHAF